MSNVRILMKIVQQQEMVVLLFLYAVYITKNQFAMLLHPVKMDYKDASGIIKEIFAEIKFVMIYLLKSMLNVNNLI